MRQADKEADTNQKKEGLTDPQCDLLAAKIRFAKAVENLNPLGIVKERPFLSVGFAFILGFGLTPITKINLSPLPLLLQIGDIAMRVFLSRKD